MRKTNEGRDLLRLLMQRWPVDSETRARLINYIKATLPPTKRTPLKREPYTTEWLGLRRWINEALAEERAKLGDKYNEDEALNKLVPAWKQSRRSLRVLIAKKLRGRDAEVARIEERWSEPDDD